MTSKMSFGDIWKGAAAGLQGNWCAVIGISFLFNVIMGAANYFVGSLGGIVLAPLSAGMCQVFLNVVRKKRFTVGILFSRFSEYGRFVWGVCRPAIFILLWSLLLIVPGIIASMRYWLTLPLMLDDPTLNAKEAMTISSELMEGNKLRLFGYGLILTLIIVPATLLTLGIALFWLVPLSNCFYAQFYIAVCQEKGFLPGPLQFEVQPEAAGFQG